MIDYQTFHQIHHLHEQERLTAAQIARQLNLHAQTVAKWLARPKYERRAQPKRKSKLDPFKSTVARLLAQHPFTAQQLFQRLHEAGYAGGYTLLTDYVRHVRPASGPAFLTLQFAPGQCAQVDWGSAGWLRVGATRRRLSFFVMVLCYSRRMYVEFTLAQTQEHFLACHQHAFEYFGGETHQVPQELFAQERPQLRPLTVLPYDLATLHTVLASRRCRVTFDTNRYSVPPACAGQSLVLKVTPDRLYLYHRDQLIAEHVRSYDRYQDYECAEHVAELLAQRRQARAQQLLPRFLALSPKAAEYYRGLEEKRGNPRHHVQKIVALSEIYGVEKVQRALEDAWAYQAFSCEYIANLLEQRERPQAQPGALHLTRQQDLLDLDLPAPDLSLYESPEGGHP